MEEKKEGEKERGASTKLKEEEGREVDQCCIAFFFSFGEKVNELEHLLFKEERSCLVPVKENALAFCI